MSELIRTIVRVSIPVFVVTSMIGMGLSLTVKQIVGPLKNRRLVLLSLLANFVLVPVFIYIITALIPISRDQRTVLIILSLAAGAPFLPKLASVAKGNEAFSIGLMLLLMVVTIFYIPLVMPLFFGGAEVNPLAIAKSLIIMMLIPLVLSLAVRAYAETIARKFCPLVLLISNIALVLLVVSLLVLHIKEILAMIGFPLLAMLLFLCGAMLMSFPLGDHSNGIRKVLSLGTGQRNIAAAILVADKNKGLGNQQEILITMVAFAIIGLLVMMASAKWMAWKFNSEN